MLKAPLVFALNHLLDNASWARARLTSFAGQTLTLQGGPWRLGFIVTDTGRFQAHTESDEAAAVSITLPPAAPFLLFTDSERLLQQAQISGNVDFAESLNFVFRNLEWDMEADLAALIGDIPARRLTRLGRALRERLRQKAENLAANVSEYLRDEAGCLISPRQMARFAAEVQAVDAETTQQEKRLRTLEKRLRVPEIRQ
ncbi:MAG: hypothetical protein LBQ81_10270 [Zoogloeaceae bacterium]|jgi:ubiquinone biosynthesis protein UbiJ|nr:hypothetical protein [Zoogloeaceae bacterium]